MHGESNERLRQVVLAAKHIEREQADEADIEQAGDARSPVQNFQ